MAIRDYRNVHEMLEETVARCGSRPAYRTILESGETVATSWNEFRSEVRRAAKSLIALGIAPNDKVDILSYSNYRWVLTDLALLTIGSCAVGIYHSLLPKQVEQIVTHSDGLLVFAEDESQLEKLLAIRDRVPDVRKVILFKGTPPAGDWVMSFEQFLELGSHVSDADLEQRITNVGPADVATIVYTSGTTGIPKGAVLTHDNITFTAQSVRDSFQHEDGDHTLLFLPLAHVFARTCVFTALAVGATTTFARRIDTVAEDFRIARPHWFPSAPRIYEKVYSKIISGVQAKGGLSLKIFNWAFAVGRKVSDLKVAKKPIPPLLAAKYAVADKLVFSKVQAALGGRVRWCISGSAPLNPEIGRFFHAAGVLILEGIGMTENTSFTNVNRFDDYRFGWVGPTGPGIEQKVAEDGEVLYRGRNIMREYYKMPEETAETLTPDGWQHTGDLGEIDDQGFLRITGRKKDLIVTAGGKNVAPAAIEGMIAMSKYVSQICVVGDRRPYLTALIAPEMENISEFAAARGLPIDDPDGLLASRQVTGLVRSVIEETNHELASFETIKDFRFVPEFTIDNGLLTPTLKIKRNLAVERYADLIDEMYAKS